MDKEIVKMHKQKHAFLQMHTIIPKKKKHGDFQPCFSFFISLDMAVFILFF